MDKKKELKYENSKFILNHELMHNMFKNGLKNEERKRIIWNISSDHAIHSIFDKIKNEILVNEDLIKSKNL